MAKTTWGRKETIIWPYYRPLYTYGTVFVAVVLIGLFLCARLRFGNTPLQRYYMPVYERTSVIGAFTATHRSTYRMLFLAGRGVPPGPAMDGDLILGKTPEPGGRVIPLALSETARQHGYNLLFRGPQRSYVDARLRDYLKDVVYDGSSLSAFFRPLLDRRGVGLRYPATVCRQQRCGAAKAIEVWTAAERPGATDAAAVQQDCQRGWYRLQNRRHESHASHTSSRRSPAHADHRRHRRGQVRPHVPSAPAGTEPG